jgi:hypothetical protein
MVDKNQKFFSHKSPKQLKNKLQWVNQWLTYCARSLNKTLGLTDLEPVESIRTALHGTKLGRNTLITIENLLRRLYV